MSDLLQQAIEAKTCGDLTLAKRLLSQALIQQPYDETAWMMMADLVEDVRQRRNCLERAVAINPKNTDAIIALTRLTTSPLSPVTRGERDKPLNPPDFEKTPPFSWEGGKEPQFESIEQTDAESTREELVHPQETIPTFDWAHDSDEPDKTIQKIFTAVSSPELVYQPKSDLSSDRLDNNVDQSDVLPPTVRADEDSLLDELVGTVQENLNEQTLASLQGFTMNPVPPLGSDALTSEEESIDTEFLLWDNPKLTKDRMVILSNKSLIYATPKPSDIPHIMGLYEEKKMLRDLLGKDTGMIKLDSITRLTSDRKKTKLTLEYMLQNKSASLSLSLSSHQVRDEVLSALKTRLGPDFLQTTRTFSLPDKIVPPLIIILLVVFLAWGIGAGLPMLSSLPASQLGQLQLILPSLLHFVSSVSASRLILIIGIFGLVSLIWMINNLSKPTNLVIVEHR